MEPQKTISVVLTNRRKALIQKFKGKWPITDYQLNDKIYYNKWITHLHDSLHEKDKCIELKDVKRWISVHKWIKDPNGVPPGLKTLSLGSKKSKTKTRSTNGTSGYESNLSSPNRDGSPHNVIDLTTSKPVVHSNGHERDILKDVLLLISNGSVNSLASSHSRPPILSPPHLEFNESEQPGANRNIDMPSAIDCYDNTRGRQEAPNGMNSVPEAEPTDPCNSEAFNFKKNLLSRHSEECNDNQMIGPPPALPAPPSINIPTVSQTLHDGDTFNGTVGTPCDSSNLPVEMGVTMLTDSPQSTSRGTPVADSSISAMDVVQNWLESNNTKRYRNTPHPNQSMLNRRSTYFTPPQSSSTDALRAYRVPQRPQANLNLAISNPDKSTSQTANSLPRSLDYPEAPRNQDVPLFPIHNFNPAYQDENHPINIENAEHEIHSQGNKAALYILTYLIVLCVLCTPLLLCTLNTSAGMNYVTENGPQSNLRPLSWYNCTTQQHQNYISVPPFSTYLPGSTPAPSQRINADRFSECQEPDCIRCSTTFIPPENNIQCPSIASASVLSSVSSFTVGNDIPVMPFPSPTTSQSFLNSTENSDSSSSSTSTYTFNDEWNSGLDATSAMGRELTVMISDVKRNWLHEDFPGHDSVNGRTARVNVLATVMKSVCSEVPYLTHLVKSVDAFHLPYTRAVNKCIFPVNHRDSFLMYYPLKTEKANDGGDDIFEVAPEVDDFIRIP